MLWNDLVDMSCLKKFAEAFGVGGTTAKIKKHTDNEGFCSQNPCKCPSVFDFTLTY